MSEEEEEREGEKERRRNKRAWRFLRSANDGQENQLGTKHFSLSLFASFLCETVQRQKKGRRVCIQKKEETTITTYQGSGSRKKNGTKDSDDDDEEEEKKSESKKNWIFCRYFFATLFFLLRLRWGEKHQKQKMLSFFNYDAEPLSPTGGGASLDLPARSFTTEYEDECVSVR